MVESGVGRKGSQCACCFHFTLPESTDGEICPVCFWEDDIEQINYPDKSYGSPNHMSLNTGRDNFQVFGVCKLGHVKYVRAPIGPEVNSRWREEYEEEKAAQEALRNPATGTNSRVDQV